MGQAAVSPDMLPVRRVLAWALALLANGSLVALILLSPRPPTGPPPLQTIDLVLVASPEPETEFETEPEPPAEPEPEVQPEAELPPPPQPQQRDAVDEAVIASGEQEEDDATTSDASQPLAAAGIPDYGITTLEDSAALSGTAFVVREIFCLTSSEATREAGHCPDTPDPDGLSMLRYASDSNRLAGLRAAIGHGMSPEEIRALFEAEGLPLADLSGQSTLADTSARSTSSSDDMRDSLPARHPDPAFGD